VKNDKSCYYRGCLFIQDADKISVAGIYKVLITLWSETLLIKPIEAKNLVKIIPIKRLKSLRINDFNFNKLDILLNECLYLCEYSNKKDIPPGTCISGCSIKFIQDYYPF
jgi:hypothetical protein